VMVDDCPTEALGLTSFCPYFTSFPQAWLHTSFSPRTK
jgi:hypothetical protein